MSFPIWGPEIIIRNYSDGLPVLLFGVTGTRLIRTTWRVESFHKMPI